MRGAGMAVRCEIVSVSSLERFVRGWAGGWLCGGIWGWEGEERGWGGKGGGGWVCVMYMYIQSAKKERKVYR